MKALSISIIFIAAITCSASPNFIFMLSDDQDWAGLSVQMHPEKPGSKSAIAQTRNIARLASEGIRFSAAYAPASVCSPTRVSLQTGRSPAALQWTKAAPTVTARDGFKMISPTLRKNIASEEVTLAELLKGLGYATAHYGKWHIGGGGPEAHGYDESDGDTGNGDAEPFKDPNPVDIFGMGERAKAFMKKHVAVKKPFYIQLSYHALHYPQNASAAARAKYTRLLPGERESVIGRAAITDDLDRGVGVIMDAVEELGLLESTYLIYMSDNGGGGKKGGRLLSGGKGSVWEGGIRVPLIIRGPGIAMNSWCHERVVGYDLLPTLYKMAGGNGPLPSGIEGGDFSHLLRGGDAPVKRPREELVFHFPHYQSSDGPHTSMLLGEYKLIHFFESGENKLFKLDEDIGEAANLAREDPARTQEMYVRLKNYLSAVNAQWPVENPQYDPDHSPDLKSAKRSGGKRGKKTRRQP